MKEKILKGILQAGMHVAVTQGSKYLTRPLVLPEESFERVNQFIDRVEREVRPFEGIDLDKPMTVIRASANFAKSKIARQQRKKVKVERVDMDQVHKAVRIAANMYMGVDVASSTLVGEGVVTWENYASCHARYVKYVVETYGHILEDEESAIPVASSGGSSGSGKTKSLQTKAKQIMSLRQDLFMSSPLHVLDNGDQQNILTKHLLVQKELTILGQVFVKENVLEDLLRRSGSVDTDAPIELGHSAILTLYGAYAPTTTGKREAKASRGLTYEDLKDYVVFIIADVHKSYGSKDDDGSSGTGAGKDRKESAAESMLMGSLYDLKTSGRSGLDERSLMFVPSTYIDAHGRVLLHDRLREVFWQQCGNIAEVVNEQDKPWLARGVSHSFVNAAEYQGAEKDLWQDWKAYMAAQTPNTVLLWGRPGCGKTTLIREGIAALAREGKRCLFMDNSVYRQMSNVAWANVVEKYRPDLLWVDDIDRVDRSELSQSLARIDRNHYKVPLTIFTSNSLKRIPPAFYRTDRIDYIYEIKISDDSLKLMMRNLLIREGVDPATITDTQFADLLKLSENGTAADMLKYIRRGKILGWDRMTCPYDLGIRVLSDED